MKDPTKPPYMCDDHEYYSEDTACPKCDESCIVTAMTRATQDAQLDKQTEAKVSDDDIRALWVAHGGAFNGPTVETGTMPEEKLLPFLRKLMEAK